MELSNDQKMGLAVQEKSVCQNIYQKKFQTLRRFGDAERLGWHVLDDNRLDSEDLAGKVDWPLGLLFLSSDCSGNWTIGSLLGEIPTREGRSLKSSWEMSHADARTNFTQKFWLLPAPNSSDGFVALWVLLTGGFISIVLVDMQHLREVQHPQPVAPKNYTMKLSLAWLHL